MERKTVKSGSNNTKLILCSLILFLMIYNGTISGINVLSNERIAIVMSVVACIVLSHGKFILKKDIASKAVMKMLCFQLFLLVYVIFLNITIGRGEGNNIFNSIVLFLLYVPIAFYCLSYLFNTVDDFMKCLVLISTFQSIIIIFCLFVPPIAQIVDSFFNKYEYFDYSLMRASGYAAGILCITSTGTLQLSVGLIACVYYIVERNKSFSYLIVFLIQAIATIAVSRTGLLIVMLCVTAIFFESSKRGKPIFFKIFIGFTIGSLGLYLILVTTNQASLLPYLFRRIIRLLETGVYNGFLRLYFHSSSTVIPPISFETILGTGITSGTSGNGITINADGGYIRNYVAMGLPLAIIFYVFFDFGLMIRAMKQMRVKKLTYISTLFIMIMLVGEFKEPFFYSKYYFIIYYVFISLAEKSLVLTLPVKNLT